MDASRAGNGRIFDLLAQPWRMLRVDPAATNQQIHDAFAQAQQNPMAATATLVFARNALLDPNRRLPYELTYPLDCPAAEVEAFYAALSSDTSIEDLLNFSDRLWPLARANFIAHIASHRPAYGPLLYALLESHAAMNATDVYTRLKVSRAAAGLPAPSLTSVNQSLDELLNAQASAVFAGYDTIQDAAGPVLECTRQILANGERHFVEALGRLLVPYRQAIGPLQTDATEQIESACVAIQRRPADAFLLEELSSAVLRWTSLCRPLLMWHAHHGPRDSSFETPVEQLRSLIAHLTANQHYDLAIEITDVTRDVFGAVPTTIEELAEDARVMASLSQYASMKQLEGIIRALEFDPDPLIAALEKDGFGQTSTEPAKFLWVAFAKAASATNATQWSEVPWQVMRDFAVHFSNKPEAAAAVAHLISGLIEYGTRVAVAPNILKPLRDNLNFMKSFMGVETMLESFETLPSPKEDSFFSRQVRRLNLRSLRVAPNLKRKHLIGLSAFILIALVPLAAYFVGLDEVRSFWSKTLAAALPQQAIAPFGAETKPPVGTGQHLALDGVRYCHFQQERLRIVKEKLQGPEDAKAYNLLIVDYNSRCSDYFYQDNDLKTVLAEVSANKTLLEADAKRIMSTWPGRTAEGVQKK